MLGSLEEEGGEEPEAGAGLAAGAGCTAGEGVAAGAGTGAAVLLGATAEEEDLDELESVEIEAVTVCTVVETGLPSEST